MKNRYTTRKILFVAFACLVTAIASCKKDDAVKNTNTIPTTATPAKIGMYESDSSIYKLIYVDVSQVGTQTIDDGMIFDTGSGGMVLDANGIIPKSMITSTGFNFTGDSVVYDGITITSDTSSVEYGDDANTTAYVHGNLAYANIVLDQEGGDVTIKRVPFFLYYKAVDSKGNAEPSHEFDVFGVNEEYDVTFNNGAEYITSPLSAYTPGTGLTKGFKMAALGTTNFTLDGNYVKGVVTLGLTKDDLASTSSFTFSQLTSYPQDGYPPIINSSITYDSKTISSYILFDTGTEPYNYIEDNKASSSFYLPVNSAVQVAATSGFNYNFTVTSSDYLTYVENPKSSGVDVSIFSLEYFLNNEIMMDYADHKLGLKNN